MHKYTLQQTVKLSESDLQPIEMMNHYGEALGNIIKKDEQFKTCCEEAIPAGALTDPLTIEQIRQAEVVWALDVNDESSASILSGTQLLGYLVARNCMRPVEMLCIRYDSKNDSLGQISKLVRDLRRDYEREHNSIKKMSDTYPLFALSIKDIADPKVRAKVREAELITVVNSQDPTEGHAFPSRNAQRVTSDGDEDAKQELKSGPHSLDHETQKLS
jgi:hypothetical protein